MLPTLNQEHFTQVTLLHWNSASQPLPSLKPRVGESRGNVPRWSKLGQCNTAHDPQAPVGCPSANTKFRYGFTCFCLL